MSDDKETGVMCDVCNNRVLVAIQSVTLLCDSTEQKRAIVGSALLYVLGLSIALNQRAVGDMRELSDEQLSKAMDNFEKHVIAPILAPVKH